MTTGTGLPSGIPTTAEMSVSESTAKLKIHFMTILIFLKSVPRYSFLFDLNSSDYKAWAHGLKKAGYATNPDYANMLIRTIEENELWHFDRGIQAINPMPPKTGAVNEPFAVQAVDSSKKKIATSSVNMSVMARVPRVLENNRIQYIIVKDGDTRENLRMNSNY